MLFPILLKQYYTIFSFVLCFLKCFLKEQNILIQKKKNVLNPFHMLTRQSCYFCGELYKHFFLLLFYICKHCLALYVELCLFCCIQIKNINHNAFYNNFSFFSVRFQLFFKKLFIFFNFYRAFWWLFYCVYLRSI